MNLSKRAKTSTTTNTSQSQSSDARNAKEEDFFVPAPVPMGRDAAKAAKRKLKGVAVEPQQFNEVNESLNKLETQLSSLSSVYRDSTDWDKEKHAELKVMHAERMRVKAMKMLLKDTTRMTPEQLKAFEATRDELSAKYLKR